MIEREIGRTIRESEHIASLYRCDDNLMACRLVNLRCGQLTNRKLRCHFDPPPVHIFHKWQLDSDNPMRDYLQRSPAISSAIIYSRPDSKID